MQEMQFQFLSQEDLLEKEMATHSTFLAWETPRTEKPGRLQSMGSVKSQMWLSDKITMEIEILNMGPKLDFNNIFWFLSRLL